MIIDINEKIDWVAFFEQYVPLKKSGKDDFVGLCPFHDDRNPSFHVRSTDGVWHCFGCDERGNATTFLVKMGIAKDTKEAYKMILNYAGISQEDLGTGVTFRYTLEDYALEKKLDVKFLTSLGLTNGKDCVNIPYKDVDGTLVRMRQRYSPASKKRFNWSTGTQIIPYGLWLLQTMKAKNHIFLVEGESDAQTLWFHQIPALGIPGANTFKDEWVQYIEDFDEIYIYTEPDKGGTAFLRRVCEALQKNQYQGKVYMFTLDNFKDVSDLHVNSKDEKEFAENFEEALERAQLIDLSTIVNEPDIDIPGCPVKLRTPVGWKVNEDGIWKYNDKKSSWDRVTTTPILFTKKYRLADSAEQKLEMVYYADKKWHTMLVEGASVLHYQEIIKLANYGISIGSKNAKDIADFLFDLLEANLDLIKLGRANSQLGWVDDKHFIPGLQGDIVLDLDPGSQQLAEAYEASGELEDWVQLIKPYRENSIFRFMLASSFAAPLLRILGHRVFVVHNWGDSRSGKTAALKAALSVWGDPVHLLTTFNSTKVGLEKMAALFNDLPLGVDEKQVVGKKQEFIEQLIYMLSLGTSKTRGTRTGGVQTKKTWRSIILTTGEETLTEENSSEGVYTRTLEIYGRPCPTEVEAERLHRDLEDLYGVAGPAYIKQLVKAMSSDSDFPRQLFRELKDIMYERYASKKIEAHLSAVALVATADILASQFVFGESEEEAREKALKMADDIANAIVDLDVADVVLQAYEFVKSWVIANKSLFIKAGTTAEASKEYYGLYEESKNMFYIYPYVLQEALRKQGFSYRKTLQGFTERGYVETEISKRGDKEYKIGTVRKRINGSLVRVIGLILKDDIEAEPIGSNGVNLPPPPEPGYYDGIEDEELELNQDIPF